MTKLCVCDKNSCESKETCNVQQSCVRVVCDKVVCVCDKSHQSQTSAISATPATQSEGRCHQAPRLHAECTPMSPSATPATQSGGRYRQVPRLPRRMHIDVAKCHACHAKWRSMSPSATPATQTVAATTASTGNQARHQSQPSPVSAMPATQNARRCRQVPGLPRRMHVYVAKCHACQAECTLMSPRATPATQTAAATTASTGNQACHQSQPSAVSATPACHAECTSMSPSATLATQRAAATTASTGNQVRHQSQPSAVSATPATHWLSGFHVDCQGITWRDRLKQK